MRGFERLPLFVVLSGLSAALMMLPAVHASVIRDLETARAFFYSSILFLVVSLFFAIAMAHYDITRQGRSHLISMFAFFAFLPAALAVPFREAVPDTTFLNAYVEMVSSLTTTGLTMFEPERLPPTLHLWRATVGWAGGFFVWVTAIAILAPLNLGGFEVASTAEIGQGASTGTRQIDKVADGSERLRRYGMQLAPIYGGLTVVLWIGLVIAGDTPFVAICHAMATLSTSGISPLGGTETAASGWRGEIFIFLFFVFALSRLTFASDDRSDGWRTMVRDPELRFGLAIIAILPLLLFARHFASAVEGDVVVGLREGFAGLWGGVFTVASFLTTTGFVSTAWGEARAWSGLETPGLLLMGLAFFGGGVATTAGGVKLLRIYALWKHGVREMEKLVMPSSVGGSGQMARRFRRQGAYVAWIFFMLFAISVALTMLALSLTGVDFEDAAVLTVAALATAGPLTQVATETPMMLSALPGSAKAIISAAMVLGRLETLAIIALANPEFWR